MTSVSKTVRKLRIIAVPLTRPNPGLPPRSQRVLTHYLFQLSSPQPPPYSTQNGKENGEGSVASKWLPEEGVVKWVTTKAGNVWAGFGKADGGWKLKVFQMGEKLVDRLDFEELALKGIDPSLGPSIAAVASTPDSKASQKLFIPLIYPPSLSSNSAVLSELRALLAFRTPRHRKGFFLWLVLAPLAAPLGLIPVIPNIPFFFCVWRSYSHYRAYKSSQYLQSLIDQDTIEPEPSDLFDGIYKAHAPPSTPSDAPTPSQLDDQAAEKRQQPQHELLLTRSAVPTIIALFELKRSAEADLYRAFEQARVRVQSGRQDL